ncbi:peroxiredoxin [Iodidimonas muriae]|uniref:Glutathione-dependent peroxiredoxin n=1 Tax=Iodidimonas muriae TaxID=261467 RepID=A0ABQ2LDA6_9PROT|nr:peroxiredoxin [Iodidimonas muriae]GGO10912.1 peroxiredoxin [Iodidimonas muriae]
MAIKKGDKLPSTTLSRMGENGPEKVETDALFAGKTAVVFAVPGAFTPTCSARHLPGFVDHLDAIKAKDVDMVACLSVNDVFVMNAWGKSADAKGIEMLADGNGDFAKAMGLEMDGTGFGMGTRSQRYAMIVKDGVVSELFVEEPGAFEVSSAEHVLKAL